MGSSASSHRSSESHRVPVEVAAGRLEESTSKNGIDILKVNKTVRGLLKKAVHEHGLPSAGVLVCHDGEEVYFGEESHHHRQKWRKDSIFRIHSLTKVVTTVAALILVEEGKLCLEDPISKFLGPNFAKENLKVVKKNGGLENCKTLQEAIDACEFEASDSDVTVFHLLTHTSGYSYGMFFPFIEGDKIYQLSKAEKGGKEKTLKDLVERLSALPLVFQPGSCWNYSYSTDLLGRIVEVISGETIETFFQENIFKPLGMVDTSFFVPKEKKNRVLDYYKFTPDGIKRAEEPGEYESGCKESPGGGLVSTFHDLSAFFDMLLHEGFCKSRRVQMLSRRTVELMTSNHLPNKSSSVRSVLPNADMPFPLQDGFGLGVGVVTTPQLPNEGSYFWAALGGTWFLNDPRENLFILYGQHCALHPESSSVRSQITNAIYGCLTSTSQF